MFRWIARIVGIGFVGVLLLALYGTVSGYISSPPAPLPEASFHREPRDLDLASNGPFGKFDRAQLQRGLQVYTEVCSACHSLSRVTVADLGALGYKDAQIKAYAGSGNFWKIEVPSINPETGEATTRKATPADHFPSPYANETAGKAANNGALPPDLSLITKAREGGAAYVYSLITGYRKQAGYKNEKGEELLEKFPTAKTPTGLYFNPYFANLNIHMPPPLTTDDQVAYGPGSPKPTVDQMAKDVAAFLVWTAEPKLENRHRAGEVVVLFLLFATILGYLSYQNIWAEAKRKVAPIGALDPANKAKNERSKTKAGIAG